VKLFVLRMLSYPQDAPETIEKVLRNEQDLSTRRNAFVMLANHAQVSHGFVQPQGNRADSSTCSGPGAAR
jgi:hypothetical protein